MIHYASKEGANPIKTRAWRVGNKVTIETEYKNSSLADIALALWVSVHRERKFKVGVEIEDPIKKEEFNRLNGIAEKIKKIHLNRIIGKEPARKIKVMGVPIRIENES